MSDKKIILSSLALDLRRVALGYYRGSNKMAERFFDEALKRKSEGEAIEFVPYVKKLLEEFENIRSIKDEKKKAEDALMYSVLFQNAAVFVS